MRSPLVWAAIAGVAIAALAAAWSLIRADPPPLTPGDLCRGHGGVHAISYHGLHGRDEVACRDNRYFVLP